MKLVVFLVLLVVLSASFAICGTPTYNVIDLSRAGERESVTYGINDSNQVVMHSFIGVYHWIRWENGIYHDLVENGGGSPGEAHHINSSGSIAGAINISPEKATYWTNNGFVILGTFGGNESWAYGINDSNELVGSSQGTDGLWHATLWRNTTPIDLTPSSEGSVFAQAHGINNLGQVAGFYQTIDGSTTSFFWDNGVKTTIGKFSAGDMPLDVNDLGQVVGHANNKGYVWKNGQLTALSSLNYSTSYAEAINNSGQVVGFMCSPYAGTNYHAFIWQGGITKDINTLIPADSGWEIVEAADINNNGYIVGTGIKNGHYGAVLLAPVPEPSGILALGGGLVGLIGIIKRKK